MFAAASPFAPARAPRGAAHAYHQLGVQTGVDAASPHKLVVMLFDGLLDCLARAEGAISAGDVETKCSALIRAVRIVDEGLRAPLNRAEGGDVATDLANLYAYITMRLTQANLNGDVEAIAECRRLIEPVRSAWVAIGPRVGDGVQ